MRQIEYENKSKQEKEQSESVKPLHMFISGLGGTGKSFLIEAIKGAMFYLPLPLENTMETLNEVGIDSNHLPDPELYIIINGQQIISGVA